MSTDARATAKRIVEELFNKGNVALTDELVSGKFVDRNPFPGTDGLGPQYIKRVVTMLRSAFPDLRYAIEDELTDGDKVVQRLTASGTQKGEFQGMPATGKRATWSEIHIGRFENSKLVEHWGNVDQISMLQQLGQKPELVAAAR